MRKDMTWAEIKDFLKKHEELFNIRYNGPRGYCYTFPADTPFETLVKYDVYCWLKGCPVSGSLKSLNAACKNGLKKTDVRGIDRSLVVRSISELKDLLKKHGGKAEVIHSDFAYNERGRTEIRA